MRRLARCPRRLLLCSVARARRSPAQVEDDRAGDASRVLGEILRIPEESIPTNLLAEAQAIAVIPNVVKAGFVVGGRRGRGLIAMRGADGTWSNPSFVTLTGGSFGFQAGVQSADVILVFRSKRGVDSIVNGKFTLGADASVAAGPVGRSAQASTDEQLKAEIYSYSRARGLFAGVVARRHPPGDRQQVQPGVVRRGQHRARDLRRPRRFTAPTPPSLSATSSRKAPSARARTWPIKVGQAALRYPVH